MALLTSEDNLISDVIKSTNRDIPEIEACVYLYAEASDGLSRCYDYKEFPPDEGSDAFELLETSSLNSSIINANAVSKVEIGAASSNMV